MKFYCVSRTETTIVGKNRQHSAMPQNRLPIQYVQQQQKYIYISIFFLLSFKTRIILRNVLKINAYLRKILKNQLN